MSEMVLSRMRNFHVEVNAAFGTEVEIVVRGMISTSDFIAFQRCLREALASLPEKIYVNMEEVTFLSAAGVWVLLEAQILARSQGADIVVSRCSPAARNTLDILGVKDALLMAGIFCKEE